MGFTLYDALAETTKLYHLKVLAGKKCLKNTSISWVHLVEDTNIINRFWGNELAVTTGMGCDTKEKIQKVIELLLEHKGAGLIINTGKYIETVPRWVIDYCEEHDFPLLTVPWEVHTADLIKDYCFRIFQVQQEDKEMSKAFIELMTSSRKLEKNRAILKGRYEVDGRVQIAVIYIENRESVDLISIRHADYHIRCVLDHKMYRYCFFKHLQYYILIVNEVSNETMKELCNFLVKTYRKILKHETLFIGIGTNEIGVANLAQSYKCAKAALHMAMFQKKQQIFFDEMGVYQLFFTMEDTVLLKKFCDDVLSVLQEYDTLHHSNYEETLDCFLKHNGSIQMIANELYTHRNTVSYRMNKIKALLKNELETPKERFIYQMAFYIKEILPFLA